MATKLRKIVRQDVLAGPNDFGFSAIGKMPDGVFVGTIEIDLDYSLDTSLFSGFVDPTSRLREYRVIPEVESSWLTLETPLTDLNRIRY